MSKASIVHRPGVSWIKLTFILVLGLSNAAASEYGELVEVFHQWRTFERPPSHAGAPDYRAATFASRRPQFEQLRKRLHDLAYTDWPVGQQVDRFILLAEMNGYDFNQQVLKPWERDPAFYKSVWTQKSDVPAHEGPTHHAVTELWTYRFPLSQAETHRLTTDLSVIAPLMQQAQQNLIGNAADLWVTGIRDIREQSGNLAELATMIGESDPALAAAAAEARIATDELIGWLESEAPSKTGPSGIGKENYTWYQRNVHLVPLSWEDEERLLKRELDRAWAALKLEEHRNRNLPELVAASTPAEYAALADRAATHLIEFLREQEIVTVADYFEPALREQLGQFVPSEKRNFFYIGSHYDPLPLFSHFYHWFELARMDHDPHPSPLRKGPLLYNIFDSRNEGTATAVEEMFMQAGLYDNSPRSKEIVYIMIAQRAARGLGSLYAHANEMSMAEAGQIHTEWTPRGWMKTEPELMIFEQHLYMRQPGYGTSYITGKYLLERTMADYAKLQESQDEPFQLREFMDQLNTIGNIPIALGRWQMTGLDDEIRAIFDAPLPIPTSDR